MKLGKFLICIFILFAFFSCSEREKHANNSLLYTNELNKNILSFTISDKDEINSKYSIKDKGITSNHIILLPFETIKIENSIDVLSTAETYSEFTVVNYNTNAPGYDKNSCISFIPKIENSDDIDIENLDKGLYFIKSGVERKFIFNNSINNNFKNKFNQIVFDSIKLIAVDIPSKAKIFENPKQDNYATAIAEENNTKIYDLSKTGNRKIVVHYNVELNEMQNVIIEILFKFLAIFLLPFIEFIFIRPNKLMTSTKKKKLLIYLVVVQILIIFSLIYLSFGTEITKEKISDYFGIGLSAILTFFMLYIKSGEEAKKEN